VTDPWLQIRVHPGWAADGDHRAALVTALVDAGSQGVVEDGASLVAYVNDRVDPRSIRDALSRVDPGASVEIARCVLDDWATRWRDGVGAHEVGSLRVVPPWLVAEGDDPRTIVIDPGMAFGTGEHATTRGMLRLLSNLRRPGPFVADLGSGSGVLAIAAAKLGATRVAAIDIDADTVSNAETNIRLNGVADRVHLFTGDARIMLPLLAPVDVITANITSSTIVELLPIMRRTLAPPGRAILGGMLVEERPAMTERLGAASWRCEADDVEDEWWATTVARS
jgi:ribosomal protein L11 methyltransferase